MTTYCLTCGKPVRPGAKFCGNCGAAVGVGIPPELSAVCPHCSALVRSDANFCNNCGKSIATPVKEVVAPAAKEPVGREAKETPKDKPPVKQSSAARPGAKPSSSKYIIWIAAFGVLVCMAVLFAGILSGKIPGLADLRKPTSTPTAQPVRVPTTPVAVVPSATNTPVVTKPPEIPPLPAGRDILADDFSQGLQGWTVVGMSIPQIERGTLVLDGPAKGRVGLVNNQGIRLAPGSAILFTALLPSPESVLRMGLVLDTGDRSQDRPYQTLIGITNSLIVLPIPGQTTQLSLSCVFSHDMKPHEYQYLIDKNKRISIAVDGSLVCGPAPSSLEDMQGWLFFSGQAFVDDVKVIGP